MTESVKPKTLSAAPDAAQAKTTKKELMEELKVKQSQLAANKARLEGGTCPTQGVPVTSIDEEKRLRERAIRKLELEMQYDMPVNPKYRFEQEQAYRDILNEEKTEIVKQQKEIMEKIEKQKEWILKSNKECEARVEALKKEINMTPEEKNEATG